MPWVVKECGRRGATGAGWVAFLILVLACVTRSSFRSPPRAGRGMGNWYAALYRLSVPDCQMRCRSANPQGVVAADLVWLGFAPRERPDALQFLSLHLPVPA